MHLFFGLCSFIIIVAGSIPYMLAIAKNEASPSRSTRIMYIALMLLGILQSRDLGSGYSLLLFYGEILQGVLVFALSIKYGHSGLSKIDVLCYTLLIINTILYLFLHIPLAGMILIITADFIATLPTIIKTYRIPKSETPIFWLLGSIGAIFSVLAEQNISLATVIFPMYLVIVNALVFLLALRKTDNKSISVEYENVY
jgi:hypothetical protein